MVSTGDMLVSAMMTSLYDLAVDDGEWLATGHVVPSGTLAIVLGVLHQGFVIVLLKNETHVELAGINVGCWFSVPREDHVTT